MKWSKLAVPNCQTCPNGESTQAYHACAGTEHLIDLGQIIFFCLLIDLGPPSSIHGNIIDLLVPQISNFLFLSCASTRSIHKIKLYHLRFSSMLK